MLSHIAFKTNIFIVYTGNSGLQRLIFFLKDDKDQLNEAKRRL